MGKSKSKTRNPKSETKTRKSKTENPKTAPAPALQQTTHGYFVPARGQQDKPHAEAAGLWFRWHTIREERAVNAAYTGLASCTTTEQVADLIVPILQRHLIGCQNLTHPVTGEPVPDVAPDGSDPDATAALADRLEDLLPLYDLGYYIGGLRGLSTPTPETLKNFG